jgi:hypothetical protein
METVLFCGVALRAPASKAKIGRSVSRNERADHAQNCTTRWKVVNVADAMLNLSNTHAEGVRRLWNVQIDFLDRVGRVAARSATAVLSDTDAPAGSMSADRELEAQSSELCPATMDLFACWRTMYQAACVYEAMNDARPRLARFLSDRRDTFHRNLALARAAEQDRWARQKPPSDAAKPR